MEIHGRVPAPARPARPAGTAPPTQAPTSAHPQPEAGARPGRQVLLPTWAAKTTLAVTGIIMGLFVLVHMLGNLKLLSSAQSMDTYAAWLREVGQPVLPYGSVLWIVRGVLTACLVLHIWCALVLWRRGLHTRTPGVQRALGVRGWGARLMLPTGLLLLVFVVVHILDLTIGRVVASAQFTHPDPEFHAAANTAASLGRPVMAAFYLLVLVGLAAHLAHGLPLAWQDLGGSGPRTRAVARVIGIVVGLLILVGDAAVVIYAGTAGGGF